LAQSAPSRAQIAALTVAYFNSTKATYRNIIQRIRNEHGDTRVALQCEHIVVKSVRTFRQDIVNPACR
jgi:hypothetical protein